MWSRGRRGSELFEIEVIAAETKVVADVGNDAARNIARMPGEGDEPVGPEGIRVDSLAPAHSVLSDLRFQRIPFAASQSGSSMPVAAGGAEQFAADCAQSPLQLAAVPGRIFAHGSGGEDEFVAEGRRDGAAGVHQRLKMRLGRLLETQRGFAPIPSMRVAAGQQT
jgi:hypothetical protein